MKQSPHPFQQPGEPEGSKVDLRKTQNLYSKSGRREEEVIVDPDVVSSAVEVDKRISAYNQLKRETGYYERHAAALEHSHKLGKTEGDEAARKYLEKFEREEKVKLAQAAKEQGVSRTKEDVSIVTNIEEIKKEALRVSLPLQLDVCDVLSKSGADIVKEKTDGEFTGIIESGEKKDVRILDEFHGSTVYAMSSPGNVKDNHTLPENRDSFVLSRTADGKGYHMVMAHAVSEGPEAAGISSAFSISVANDLAGMNPTNLYEAFERANQQVNLAKEELGIPKQRLAVLGATLLKNEERHLYDVDILNAGNVHCFVLNPYDGSVVKSIPQTVNGKLIEAKYPAKKRRELLAKYSEKTNASPEQISKILTMAAGFDDETFKPVQTGLTAAPGEILIIATSDFMSALGGAEFFQDGAMGKIIAERLKKGEPLGKILSHFMQIVSDRQKSHKLEDSPVSVIGLEIPGEIGAPATVPAVHTVDSIIEESLEAAKLPQKIVLDEDELKGNK